MLENLNVLNTLLEITIPLTNVFEIQPTLSFYFTFKIYSMMVMIIMMIMINNVMMKNEFIHYYDDDDDNNNNNKQTHYCD